MADKKVLAKDIMAKWPKLKEADLNVALTHDTLSALVAKAEGMDKAKADAAVTEWMAGRSFT